jgi:hypothetical protein
MSILFTGVSLAEKGTQTLNDSKISFLGRIQKPANTSRYYYMHAFAHLKPVFHVPMDFGFRQRPDTYGFSGGYI